MTQRSDRQDRPGLLTRFFGDRPATGEGRLERMVAVGGLALATATTAFAATMIVTRTGPADLPHDFPPMIAGMDRPADPRVDYTPTGTLPKGDSPRSTASASVVIPYRIRSTDGRAAVLEGPPGRVVTVAPGDVLPTAGRVVSIERGGLGWVVVTTQRRIE